MTGPVADSLDLTPDLAAVQQALQWLKALAARDAWPSRLQFGLTLSLDEALTNVVSYAFAPRAAGAEPAYVRLEYQRRGDTVQIVMRDNGAAFDPTSIAPPAEHTTVEAAGIGGHGLQLMRHYLQQLTYARQDGENRLTMVAAWPRPADAGL